MTKSLRLNYVYFGLIFLLLAFLHSWSVILAGKLTHTAPWIFIGHAVVQAGFEALILAYVAAVLHARKARILEGLFISFTVVLCILHFIDFQLVRLMDLSIWYAFDFVLDESWRNFLELLIASTVPFSKIFLGVGVLCLGLIGAIWFFTRSQGFVVRKKGWDKLLRKPAHVLATGLVIVGVWEFTAMQTTDPIDYERYVKALPWKRGIFSHSIFSSLECSLKPSLLPEEISEKLAAQINKTDQKPNIFLFVVETLREEFLTEEGAPHLAAFRQKENGKCFKSYSSSNATQNSWFSLFYSQAPVYFGDVYQSGWTRGSPILEQFKRSGYKLHLYSGSRLSYYGMNDVLFGEQYALADDVYLDLPLSDRAAWQCDQAIIKRLCDDINRYKESEGHFFIVFIESTHFDYSWPTGSDTSFGPFPEEINFLKVACFQDGLEGIKNRYRNAIHYVDKLIGKVFTTLEEEKQFDDSIIIVTADHGEEFFEKGNLFHASGLNSEQISVPIYFHFGNTLKKGKKPYANVVSHVDIMPTIMDLVFGEKCGEEVLYGSSIFKETETSTAMSGRYNGSRSPHEFILQNETACLHARFSHPSRPSLSKSLKVLSFENDGNIVKNPTLDEIVETFGESFSELFVKKTGT